jgi:hypothetical protein
VPVLRLNVNAKVINALVPDLPFVGRREFVKVHGSEEVIADSDTLALPIGSIDTPQAVLLQTDKEVTVTLGAITLEPGGIIVVYGGTPATVPPEVENNSGDTASVRYVVFGE